MFQVQLAYDAYSISWGEPPSHVQIRRILSLKTWNSQASQTSFQMFPAMGQGTEKLKQIMVSPKKIDK